jgi:hypothetical protein
MTDKLKQIIKEEVMKLPKENQDAISALDWVKILEEIGEKYMLDENQINNLQVETFLALIGLTNPQFYAINIENQVETTKNNATELAKEITQKIFIPINNILIENIKKSGRDKSANFEQTLNFILSGGDYSSFMGKRNQVETVDSGDIKKETIQNNLEKTIGIKRKLII